MPEATPAWLLRVSENIQFCIGEHEAETYIEEISLQPVPLTPDYCNNVIFWQDLILPVIDMNKFVGYGAETDLKNTSSKHIFVISYQKQENMPLEYIAVKLSATPEKILVKDEDVCELPEEYPDTLKPYLLSLFNYNNRLTSVFDIAGILQ